MNEESERSTAEQDDRAESTRLTATLTGYPLLDDATAQVCIDQATLRSIHRFQQIGIWNVFASGEAAESFGTKDTQSLTASEPIPSVIALSIMNLKRDASSASLWHVAAG